MLLLVKQYAEWHKSKLKVISAILAKVACPSMPSSRASSPGGRNDRLVHTVMTAHAFNFREISKNSILLPPSAKWRHCGRRLELVLVEVFLLLSRTLWDRRIATSSRHNRQSVLDFIYYIAANKPPMQWFL